MTKMNLHTLETLRNEYHSECCACTGLPYRLEYSIEKLEVSDDFDDSEGSEDSEVLVTNWSPTPDLGSYTNTLHGGVQCLLIDQAMTCCLLAHGIVGVTADLQLRFKNQVTLDSAVEIRTQITGSRRSIYQIQSEIIQNKQLCVVARGKFMPRS